MTSPLVEMRTVHDSLTANNRERIYKAEAEERWLENKPNRTDNDYQAFASTNRFADWQNQMTSGLETIRVRSLAEDLVAGSAGEVDYQKLSLQPHESFGNDNVAQDAYSGLAMRFGDDALQRGAYQFDDGAMAGFKTLLAEAKAGAQRNATELAADLATAMTLAGQEVTTATGQESYWENAELHGQLEGLKTALKDWNKLLAEWALPDKQDLRDQAQRCSDKLGSCSEAHQSLMKSGGPEAVPFVKYQLLATMRAIGEKVAAQYVARAGKASYSALYELIRDVPNRGADDEAAAKASELLATWKDPANAWSRELQKLRGDLSQVSNTTATALVAEFNQSVVGVPNALASWSRNFSQGEAGTSLVRQQRRENLRENIAQVAFGLQQSKKIVDDVFAKNDPDPDRSSTKNATKKLAKKLNAIRVRYHQTFDGFAQMLNQDIAQCVQTLRQS